MYHVLVIITTIICFNAILLHDSLHAFDCTSWLFVSIFVFSNFKNPVRIISTEGLIIIIMIIIMITRERDLELMLTSWTYSCSIQFLIRMQSQCILSFYTALYDCHQMQKIYCVGLAVFCFLFQIIILYWVIKQPITQHSECTKLCVILQSFLSDAE